MKIAIVNGLDINMQGQRLAEWFRKEKRHEATNITFSPSGELGFHADVELWKPEHKDFKIKWDEYDFFILRWIPDLLGWPSPKPIKGWFDQGVLRRNNCILRIHGSDVRYHPDEWLGFWLRYGMTIVTNGYDYTLNKDLGFTVQHIPPMIDCEEIWAEQLKTKLHDDGKFWIGHAPTDPAKKGTKYLISAVEKLKEKGVEVECDVIMQVPWKEARERKARCHALYDQISGDVGIGAFGVNLLEGLAQSKICFGGYSSYVYSFLPQLRDVIVECSAESLPDKILDINDRPGWFPGYQFNQKGMEFVRSRFDVNVVGPQYENLILHVMEQKV